MKAGKAPASGKGAGAFGGRTDMAEDKDFAALCDRYVKARMEEKLRGKELNELYEACVAKGKALDMTRYAIEGAIAKRLEERMI